MAFDDYIRDATRSLGYESLKSKQEGALAKCALGRDIIVALLTGYGKNPNYCCLPHVFDTLNSVKKSRVALRKAKREAGHT